MSINPFCQDFEYVAIADGYWTYYQMVLQLEDCVYILKAIHCGTGFIFLFGHSCRHDRGIKDGSNVTHMKSGYGGLQQDMHPTNINHNFFTLACMAELLR